MNMNSVRPQKRCAIYTRKSTNKRLEHDVNSLVVQREISSAYIKSQQYRGWVALPNHYDDGGHSGSGIDRPALSKMMKDIEAGKIDVVVVYKVDRLTRSLADFVRLTEIFDRRGISLVSISQAFDTSDSMGRMILNVLLTFSQFERELIAERVRDSIRTRKRHGKMHGGLPPFGYIATPEGLVVDEPEAEIVRFIFAEFLRTRRYTQVMTAVRERGYCSSVKYSPRGKPRGGTPISPSTVYSIVQNPMYVGEIRGHQTNYVGQHEPLISRDTWKRAQKVCISRKKRDPDSRNTDHFLAGLLWDELGRHMRLDLHWHRGKTYATYVSSNAIWSQKECKRQYRSTADHLDALVLASTAEFLSDRRKLRKALKSFGIFDEELGRLGEKGSAAAKRLELTPKSQLKELFAAIAYRVELGEDQISIEFRVLELRRYLEWDSEMAFRGRPADWPCSDARYIQNVAARAVTAERWPSLQISPRRDNCKGVPDKKLIELVRSARRAQHLVEEHRELDLEALAKRQGCRPAQFARLIRLNYLAPDIKTAIIDGTQPKELDRKVLLNSNIPTDWAVQRKLYGFPSPTRAIDPRNLFGRGMWPSAEPRRNARKITS
ncbi:recombinase family protein [Erythrobacter sp. F6033]|uniref:recombinase family protein n=1 Tax=Erythrobacter sp. F6033 TaxID=2926401 RepID=UPI001FF645D4|nr:recombinase family protein [Erythrobacter sp. F6033]MCK0127536.1 recombinase family protein [Erythrobacter sp. F6033]